MTSKYLQWIRNGQFHHMWLSSALGEVRRDVYPLSELKEAMEQGLTTTIEQYQRWIDGGDSYFERDKKDDEQVLEDLRAGREVKYLGVTIPAAE